MRVFTRILCALGVIAATANTAWAAAAPPTPPPAADNNAFPDFGYREVSGWATLPGSGIKDGKVIGFIPWGECNAIEAMVTDDAGNIHAGFTNVSNFRKFSEN